LLLLKTSLTEKAEGQDSAGNILAYAGETWGTENGAALLSRGWGCCHRQVPGAAKGSSVGMPAVAGNPTAANMQNLPCQPYNKFQHTEKLRIWLTSSFKRNEECVSRHEGSQILSVLSTF